MNRHERRVADIRQARAKRDEQAEAQDLAALMDRLRRAQYMLTALVKQQGRVRIDRAMLDNLRTTDRLDVKVQEGGDLVVTYLAGEP